ncbi:MAG: CHAD domain-containing protein [Bryobacteraceae bacterium]
MKKLWDDDKALAENLQKRLPKLTAKFFKKGRRAMQSGTSWAEIHKFRLETKRFRYTLELFRPFYGPGLEERIEQIRGLQTLMGDINDCVTAGGLLKGLDGSETDRTGLEKKAQQKTRKLRRLWKENFEPAEAEQHWTEYLRRYARAPGPKTAAGDGDAPA